MEIRPVCNLGEVMGGFFYIQVEALDKLYVVVLKVKGRPETTEISSKVSVKKFYKVGNHHSTLENLLSLRDVNVIPCKYSNSSLWWYNTETKSFLDTLSAQGKEGYQTYATILKEHSLWTPFDILRMHDQNFL